MSNLISIVVPVYNVENYLESCLNSILNQSYKNIEIIVVNDGSTDNSLEIINQFLLKDKRVKLINQKNKGLGGARNTGLEYSNAELIVFVDSDDIINKTMIEKLYYKQKERDSDIVTCRYKRVFRDGRIDLISHNETYSDNLLKDILLGHIAPMAWNKLYKKKLFMNNDIRYPEELYYEDQYPLIQLFFNAKKVDQCDEVLYTWFITESSISKTISQKHIKDFFEVMKKILVYLINNKQQKYIDIFVNRVFYLTISHILVNFEKIKNKNDFLKLLMILDESFKSLFKNIAYLEIIKNKYLNMYINFLSKINNICLDWKEEMKFLSNYSFYDKDIVKKYKHLIEENNPEKVLYLKIKKLKTNSLYIYCAGKLCENLLNIIEDEDNIEIKGIIDSNVKNKIINGMRIVNIEDIELQNLEDSIIVVASEAYEKEVVDKIKIFSLKNKIKINIISPYGLEGLDCE